MTVKSIKQVNKSVLNNQQRILSPFNFTGLNNSNFLALQEKVERLDTTINAIDFSGSDIVFNNPDISAINSRINIIDISIVNINNDISININNITDINTSINNIEISLNDITLNIGEIPDIIEINTRLDTLDTSLNSVSGRIAPLDAYVYDLSLDLVEFKLNTDLSFSSTVSYLETSIQDLSSYLYSYVTTRVEEVIDSAPESLDTLRELADALSGDASFAITIQQKQTRQDASLTLLETQLQTLSTTLDTSLNTVTDNITRLDTSLNTVTHNITRQDASLALLETQLDSLATTLSGGFYSRQLLDASFSLLDTSIQDLSTDIYSHLTTRIEELIDSAPESLDTLRELADALSGDPSFAVTIMTKIFNLESSNNYIINNVYSKDYIDSSLISLDDRLSIVENIDISGINMSDVSNIVYKDSDIILDLYNNSLFLKSDILQIDNNNRYNSRQIDIINLDIHDIRLNNYSDKRINTEIEPINNSLDVINRLDPYSYNINTVYNGESILNSKEGKTIKQSEFIDQDIDKISELKHPVVQPNNPDELYPINYQNIFVYQTSAIKELHKIIVNQQNIIEDLNIRMKNLEKS